MEKWGAVEWGWAALSGGPGLLQGECQAKALELLTDAQEGKGQLFHHLAHLGARAEPGHWAREARGNHGGQVSASVLELAAWGQDCGSLQEKTPG